MPLIYRDGRPIEISDEELKSLCSLRSKSLETLKQEKIEEFSKICGERIVAGVDVQTTQGVEHFSLTLEDQANIKQTYEDCWEKLPYHADGKDCRPFTYDELAAVMNAGKTHIFILQTKLNKLRKWIRRCETEDELSKITFDSDLPEDLALEMQELIKCSTDNANYY